MSRFWRGLYTRLAGIGASFRFRDRTMPDNVPKNLPSAPRSVQYWASPWPSRSNIPTSTIPARDGYPLAATVFAPAEPQAVVLINSAAAVPRKIYRGFAELSGRTRLCGPHLRLSRHRRLAAGLAARISRRACATGRRWMSPAPSIMRGGPGRSLPLNFVGHSFGGQALGLIPNNSEVARALLVASQAGAWRLIQSPERYRVYLMMTRDRAARCARRSAMCPARSGLARICRRTCFSNGPAGSQARDISSTTRR